MDTQAFFFLVLSLMVSGTYSAKLTFTNKCSYTIWPGTLNNADKPRLSSTGFELATGVSKSIDAPVPWGGRFWARTGCSTTASKFTCSTADCGSGQIECNGAGAIPPATLAEVTIVTGGGMDFYDVSLVDGFNLPISITPEGGLSGCNSTSCAANVNSVCPSEFIVKGSDGSTIACRSACDVLKDPKYCCTGSYGSPTTCLPTNYSKIFKDACPQAYSYAYDDKTSTFTCTGGANYLITFCP